MNDIDSRADWGLRPVINVSGTMTSLGASIVAEPAIEAMRRILPQFVEMADLQRHASGIIARLTGAEAGFVTASCASGISLAVAGCLTGDDLSAIERLPEIRGERNEVVIQAGHLVNFGAPVEQSVRLTGARVVSIGQATSASPYHLAGAITERTAAALYVVSHHVVEYGQIPLELFCQVAHQHGVPVIVDAASEYDLRKFLRQGADIVLYSGHKFLGGPTSGIVAGTRELVRRAWLQNHGIGRGMKVGKESIAGVCAALQAWETRDHAGIRAREQQTLEMWSAGLASQPGVAARIEPDPTDNPLCRLKVTIDPALARTTAWDLADALAAGDPPVIVRGHLVEHGFFELDPCNLHAGEDRRVLARLHAELERARQAPEPLISDFGQRILRQQEAIVRWPD